METSAIIHKNKNVNTTDDLYKYGEYLTQELKMSNDTNTQLLENYINLTSHIKSKNEENELSSYNNEIIKKVSEQKEIDELNTLYQSQKAEFNNIFRNWKRKNFYIHNANG